MGIRVVTGMEECLHAKSKLPAGSTRRMGGWIQHSKAESGVRRRLQKGPLTKPQTRRTARDGPRSELKSASSGRRTSTSIHA